MTSLNLIYYSPTGTTQQVIRNLGQEMGWQVAGEYNITSPDFEVSPAFRKDSLTIIGLPTYGGRLPAIAAERLEPFLAKGAPAVIVTVYGNRAYEDSLLELKDIAVGCGFQVIAAAAFIGEHSFSSKNQPIAYGRPDRLDLEKIKDFSQKISSRMQDFSTEKTTADIKISGNYPYKERSQRGMPLSPETDQKTCTLCGACVENCPVNAISLTSGVITDKEQCTMCCACIKKCSQEARFFNHPMIDGLREKLYVNCSERKEPEFFL